MGGGQIKTPKSLLFLLKFINPYLISAPWVDISLSTINYEA